MRILSLICSVLFCVSAFADTEGRAKFVVTGIPLNNDTITFRGVTRTWKTVVTSSATQIAVGATAVDSANNLAAHLGGYPFTTTSRLVQESVTNISVIEDVNLTVTASIGGTWGTATVTTTTLTQRPFVLPLATESTLTRTNDANDLILAFNYASSAFGASLAALSNYVSTAGNKTITGPMGFTGVNILSNANQMFIGGIASNMNFTNINFGHLKKMLVTQGAYFQVSPELTNETPTINFMDIVGAANQNRSALVSDYTGFSILFQNDAKSAFSNVFSIARNSTYGASAATFRTWLTADMLNATPMTNGWSTNMTALHGLKVFADYLTARGDVVLTNANPTLTMWDTSAGAGLKGYQFINDNGVMRLLMGTDAADFTSLGVLQEVFEISRADHLAATASVAFQPKVYFNGGMGAVSGNVDALAGSFRSSSGFISGSTSATMPSGFAGGWYAIDGTAPSVDPTTGFAMWSAGGNLFYRSSAASEGSGGTYRIHNRTATTLGAGTDYTLTASTAFVDFGTTDPKITLPTAGTYLIWAELAVTEDGGTANDEIRAKLRNETASTDLSGSDAIISYLPAGKLGVMRMEATTTANASDVIAVWAHNNTSARGTVNSARTRIGYVRLY